MLKLLDGSPQGRELGSQWFLTPYGWATNTWVRIGYLSSPLVT